MCSVKSDLLSNLKLNFGLGYPGGNHIMDFISVNMIYSAHKKKGAGAFCKSNVETQDWLKSIHFCAHFPKFSKNALHFALISARNGNSYHWVSR